MLLLVVGTQLTAGVVPGCLSGATFGAAREVMALAPLVMGLYKLDLPQAMMLLPRLRSLLHRVNYMLVLGGGILLMIAALKFK
jgi:hypothetical protein